MSVILMLGSLLFSILFTLINSQFNYILEPADQWGGICSTGIRQSPLNFPENYTDYVTTDFFKILNVSYGKFGDGFVNTTLNITQDAIYLGNGTNRGYVLVQKNKITYRYDLVNFNFHITSEHRFNNNYGELELQIYHTKNITYLYQNGITDVDSNNVLIISTIFKVASNLDNPNINALNVQKRGPTINFNLGIYPPIGEGFMFYEGSLTTPPCTENVNWVVNHKFDTISLIQYEQISEWISTTYLGKYNRRKYKEINNRTLYFQYYPDQKSTINGKIITISIIFVIFYFLILI